MSILKIDGQQLSSKDKLFELIKYGTKDCKVLKKCSEPNACDKCDRSDIIDRLDFLYTQKCGEEYKGGEINEQGKVSDYYE